MASGVYYLSLGFRVPYAPIMMHPQLVHGRYSSFGFEGWIFRFVGHPYTARARQPRDGRPAQVGESGSTFVDLREDENIVCANHDARRRRAETWALRFRFAWLGVTCRAQVEWTIPMLCDCEWAVKKRV